MDEKPKKQITLADAYNLVTPDDSRELYAQWAPTYDKTFIEDNKYVYPAKIAEVLAKHMPADRSFSVIDIGCGTGAVGEEIAKIRPNSIIEGVDISPEMLAIAASKNAWMEKNCTKICTRPTSHPPSTLLQTISIFS